MEQRLIKASLVLLRHDQHIALVVEDLLGLGLADAVSLPVSVHAAFSVLCAVLLVWVPDTSREGNQDLYIVVVICLQICLDLVVVAHRRQT